MPAHRAELGIVGLGSDILRRRLAPVPLHNLLALGTMESKTGCTSVGEWLITRRISAVARCCASASLRAFVTPYGYPG